MSIRNVRPTARWLPWLMILGVHPALAQESTVSTRLSILSPAQRQEIEKSIAHQPGWAAGSYDLDLMDEWDNGKLPIVVALPKQPIPFSPKFAVLLDGRLVSAYEPDALPRLIGAVYGSVGAGDAQPLAKLALWFGRFEHPVGVLLTHRPANAPKELPRSGLDPVYRRDGKAHVVEFYTYDYDMRRMFDCRLRIAGTRVSTECKQIAGSVPSAEENRRG